ncbi:MAG: hypothetical protein QG553_576 [Patescibacteria group bacterium]|nr:hypothetical protein [Patescibacteria group bacterium]
MPEHAFTSRHETVPYYLGLRLISWAASQAILKAKFGVDLSKSDALALRQTAALIDPSATDSDVDTGVDRREPKVILRDGTAALIGKIAVEADEVAVTLCETAATLATVADGKDVDPAVLDIAGGIVGAFHDMATERYAMEQQNPFSEGTY